MEVRFVPQLGERGAKRKQFNTACDICKKRKKRCLHNDSGSTPSHFDGRHPLASSSSSAPAAEQHMHTDGNLPLLQPSSRSRHGEMLPAPIRDGNPSSPKSGYYPSSDSAADAPPAKGSVPKRFVGDLNPEALFLNHATPSRSPPRRPQEIGVWLERDHWDTVLREKEKDVGLPRPSTARSATENDGGCQVAEDILDDNTRTCTKSIEDIISALDWGPLISIYFSRVNMLLPILDETEFRREIITSSVSKALVQAVCLVASKDDRAKPYLHFCQGVSSVMEQREFSNALHSSILKGIRDSTQYDKVSLIRILALISLHSDGPDGAENASLHLAQAIHHSQTIGLHIGRRAHSIHEKSRNKLFWCLWSLDKINAAINGRPVMISDHDLSIEPFTRNLESDIGFEVWLRLATMLRDVISLYRPSAPDSVTGWEDGFPEFNNILDQYSGWSLSSSTLLTLHLFYLSVAILSSRSKSTTSSCVSTSSSLRQSLSTIYVTTLMCGDQHPDLPDILPLPLVPYSVSLALSVAYKKLRQSRLPHMKRQAELEFERCHWALEALRHTWWSAEIMATLARTVLREIHKGSSISNPRPQSQRQRSNTASIPAQASAPSLSRSVYALQDIQAGITQTRGELLSSFEPHNETTNRNSNQLPNDSDPSEAQMGYGIQDPFDDIDQILGTYLDPNLPVNYEDFLKLDYLG